MAEKLCNIFSLWRHDGNSKIYIYLYISIYIYIYLEIYIYIYIYLDIYISCCFHRVLNYEFLREFLIMYGIICSIANRTF